MTVYKNIVLASTTYNSQEKIHPFTPTCAKMVSASCVLPHLLYCTLKENPLALLSYDEIHYISYE